VTAAVGPSIIALPDGRRLCVYRCDGATPGLFGTGGYARQSAMAKPLGPALFDYAQRRGQACLLLDFRGQGQSPGTLADMTLPAMRDDILAVAAQFGLAGMIGIGASLGGWALLAAQQAQPGLLHGMLALAPAVDWDEIYFKPKLAAQQIGQAKTGEWVVQADGIVAHPALVETAGQARLDPARLRLPGGLRILQGEADAIVPAAATRALAARMAPCGPVSLRLLPGMDHNLTTLRSDGSVTAFAEECDLLLATAARS
jgi:pimeloyl-ACP methyl ester carboxylesterase